MKSKLTKAEFDALHAEVQKFYKVNGDHYLLDLADSDHEIGSLRRSLERERTEAGNQKTRADKLQERVDEFIADPNKAKDVVALETSYKQKLADQKTDFEGKLSKKDETIQKLTVKDTALKLATELAGDKADVLIPHLESRLQADLTGAEPITRVLGKDGKVSAMTFDELKKEFVDNTKFSGIIVASKGSGGAGSSGEKKRPATVSQTKKFGELSEQERIDWNKADPEGFKAAMNTWKQEQQTSHQANLSQNRRRGM